MSYLPQNTRAEDDSRRAIQQTAMAPSGMILITVIAALYFGRDIFVPLAIATLLAFALAPPVSFLRRRRVPRVPAVLSVVILAFLGIFAFGFVVATQVSQLGANLPLYQQNIAIKIKELRTTATEGGIVERASQMLDNLGKELAGRDDPQTPNFAGTQTPAVDEPAPLPVEIRQPNPEPVQVLQNVIGPLIEPVATGGIVIVFVIFMLLQREDLRDRFIRLVGSADIHRTTQAISDAGKRVARYLLMQLIVNTTYGIPVGLGLWWIGVPNPLLWGMLAIVLRFIPYIGPVIGALFPLALSIAVDPGWSMLLWTAALFVTLELFSNNVAEPFLYGNSTGLSPVAIILAAIFWTWLWGPIGLLVSTPLTVCLVVLGRHVPQFGFLDVLLGTEPVLSPQERLYQRLLAGDPEEATERAEEYLADHSIIQFYDDVAVPALVFGEKDRARGVLEDERRAEIAAGMVTVIENLEEDDIQPPEALIGPIAPSSVPPGRVLIIGGRGNLDDAAATMLFDLLRRQGIEALLASYEQIEPRRFASFDAGPVELISLSYLNADSAAHARYTIRRLRRRYPQVPIQVGFWSSEGKKAGDATERVKADLFAETLAEARLQIMERCGPVPREAMEERPAVPAQLETASSGDMKLAGEGA